MCISLAKESRGVMLSIENISLRQWVTPMDEEHPGAGVPFRVEEVSPPFILASSLTGGIVVFDYRNTQLSTMHEKYVAKFRKLWKKCEAQEEEELANLPASVHLPDDCI